MEEASTPFPPPPPPSLRESSVRDASFLLSLPLFLFFFLVSLAPLPLARTRVAVMESIVYTLASSRCANMCVNMCVCARACVLENTEEGTVTRVGPRREDVNRYREIGVRLNYRPRRPLLVCLFLSLSLFRCST